MTGLDVVFPRNADEISSLLTNSEILAGGTDLLVQHRAGRLVERVIALGEVAKEIPVATRQGEWLTMSALASLNELHPVVPSVLASAIDAFASTPIRNRATLGGNLANGSPAADTVPALLVLDAQVDLRLGKNRRSIDLADFLLGPRHVDLRDGEWIESIKVREHAGESGFRKIGGRRAQAISFLNLAWAWERSGARLSEVRLVMGAVAPTVRRLPTVEAIVEGQVLSKELIEAAAEQVAKDISPIDDIRASAKYRHQCAVGLIREVLTGALSNLEETTP